ncbi:hypothetical protein [Mycolicibacterium porcinum]|uniref:hypothetical protein n=1 Tax=Mycolicibacterium porcinum TaxID=39693 RepID=UPI0008492CEB|nr:hypothetical protein [Mycolicibacterium porcinum]ODR20791.1 hypothetical protein BHQ19_22135 [Mycolicibacterium porcinum]
MNRAEHRAWRQYMFGCPDLTQGQRLVLLALSTFADFPDGTNARPGVAALAEMCACGPRIVESALHHGRLLKLIDQTGRANPKAGLAATYRLLPVPVSTRTSVRPETDFNPHKTDFNPHESVISTRTSVQPTNKDSPSHNTKGESARATGTYLPENWAPAPEVAAQMRDEQPHVDHELELKKFRDYWHALAGAKARKRDWSATYRNWIRREAERTPPPTTGRTNGQSRGDAKVQGWLDAGRPRTQPELEP